MRNRQASGFTLIEILIVIAILAILATIVLVALNPARQFAQARNTQRTSGVNAILNAINQNMVDNSGTWTCGTSLPVTSTVIASSGGVNICSCLTPTYLSSLPYDPSSGSYTSCTTYNSGYNVYQDATTGRTTVSAPSAELSQTISVQR